MLSQSNVFTSFKARKVFALTRQLPSASVFFVKFRVGNFLLHPRSVLQKSVSKSRRAAGQAPSVMAISEKVRAAIIYKGSTLSAMFFGAFQICTCSGPICSLPNRNSKREIISTFLKEKNPVGILFGKLNVLSKILKVWLTMWTRNCY